MISEGDQFSNKAEQINQILTKKNQRLAKNSLRLDNFFWSTKKNEKKTGQLVDQETIQNHRDGTKFFFIPSTPSSWPSLHCSRPSLTKCFGIHEPLQYLKLFLHPRTLSQCSRINRYPNLIALDFFDLT